MTARSAPPLAPDLVAGRKRRKLAASGCWHPRPAAGKTQRWTPEELLRTLVEAEITASDIANQRLRLKAAGFPVHKTLEHSRSPPPAFPRPPSTTSPRWSGPRCREPCLVGPAGTGKSHLLVALGHAAVQAGHRVRYLTAAELVETLYQGWPTTRLGGCWTGCSATT